MKKNQILPLLLCLLLLAAALTGCGPEEPPQWTPVGGTAQTETQLPERAAPTAQPETEVTAVQEASSQPLPSEAATAASLDETAAAEAETSAPTEPPTQTPEAVTEDTEELPERSALLTTGDTESTEGEEVRYIANTNTKKFHVPDCSSVKDMKESNKLYFTGTREELIEQGYQPCKRCNP